MHCNPTMPDMTNSDDTKGARLRAHGYAAHDASGPLVPFAYDLRSPRPNDIVLEVQFCGVCHSDLSVARNEWGATAYPCVPGHEIIGQVRSIGSDVTRFKVGDLVGVGCLVDSCLKCASCAEGSEQYCEVGYTPTFNGVDAWTGSTTYGGFANLLVVREEFALQIRGHKDLARVAPLLCAGITTYSPLKHWGAGPGKRVGVVGLGGLGHIAVKLAAAMGAQVTVFTTSASKEADALQLGASDVVVARAGEPPGPASAPLDLILNTVSSSMDLDPYLAQLGRDGVMVMLGAPGKPYPPLATYTLIARRRSIAGSLVGGIADTQELLDFCAARNIGCDVEVVDPTRIDEAFNRMAAGDVKFRFVLDMRPSSERPGTARP